MVGKSPSMLNIFKNIGRISQNNVNILISGDSGTGKERLARLIHQSGPNADNPIVFINCKSLDENELKQAFNAGVTNGTLVMDELGMLAPDMQLLLLDLIENQAMKQAPGQKKAYRIISIARLDIAQLVDEGRFLKELYYQLNVFAFSIPALAGRKDDIPFLINHLLQEINDELGKNVNQVEDGVIPLLQAYHWPGNVRELRNVIMQALVLSHGELLQKKNIRIEGQPMNEASRLELMEYEMRTLADVEREHIGKILNLVSWNKQEAATVLGITRPTLNAKIDKYGLTRD